MRRYSWLSLLLVAALLATTFALPARAQDKPYEGVTITVFTQNGPFIAKPVRMFAPDWEAKTGGNVEMVNAPFGQLYEKMYSSFAMGQQRFDLIIYSISWQASFAQNGFLQPLDKFIEQDDQLNFDGILPIYRQMGSYKGKTYSVTLDGDNHIFYYRKDALENEEYQQQFKDEYGYELPVPPRTWEQHRDIAEFFDGWDWDNDGEEESGIVEAMRKGDQAYWTFFSRAAGYCAKPGQPGGLFFNPSNMKPLINNSCHVRALRDWLEAKEFSVSGNINMGSGEIRNVFIAGEAAMAIDWGDIGVMAATSDESKVQGKVGYSIMPGSQEVWDYKKKEWIDCTKEGYKCSDGNRNQAPYLAFGGWFGAIDKNSPHKEAAYDFLSYLGSPDNSYISVTTSSTGFNPYRKEHFQRRSAWLGYGFENPDAYLDAIKNTINHSNVQPDLRVPEAGRYFSALDAQLAQALAGSKTAKQALDDVAEEWETITRDVGRQKQVEAYRASLGLE